MVDFQAQLGGDAVVDAWVVYTQDVIPAGGAVVTLGIVGLGALSVLRSRFKLENQLLDFCL